MKFRRQIASILLYGLVIIVLAVPLQTMYLSIILKGLVIGLLTAILIKYAFTPKKPDLEKSVTEGGHPKGKKIDPVGSGIIQDHYQRLLESVLNAVTSIHPDYQTGIYMHDVEPGGYTLQAKTGNGFSDFIQGDNPLFKSILEGEKVQVFRRKGEAKGWTDIFSERTWRGSETVIGVPLIYKKTKAGCLVVLVNHFSDIQQRDNDILWHLAKFITMGMEDLDHLERLRVESYFQVRINNLFDQLEVKSDPTELWNSIQGLCRAFFQYDKLTLSLLNEDKAKARIALVDGMQEDAEVETEFILDQSIHNLAIVQNRIFRSNTWSKDYPHLNRFQDGDRELHNFRSILSVPIHMNSQIGGVISLERVTSRLYSLSDQYLLEILSKMIGSILSWQDAYNQMHQNAIHDGLTGLLNHKAFMERFDEEISRAGRFNHNMVLIVLDLDKFKAINDTYGHLYGDYVLQAVAKLIKSSVRTIDVVGRYGGEEFSVLLVNTDLAHSLVVAERIVENISIFKFNKDGIDVRISISAGMAGFPEDADRMRDLIARADEAMYQTKQRGGNAVTVYTEPKNQATV